MADPVTSYTEIQGLCSCRKREHRREDGGFHPLGTPHALCGYCAGTGYCVTRRIAKQVPSHPSEQQAYAQIKALHGVIEKAAKTIDHAADLLLRAGKAKEAAHTRGAAAALRDTIAGQDAPQEAG